MSPTLRIGDQFMSDRRIAGERPFLAGLLMPGRLPERGEVIVFRHPVETGKDFVNRVVAPPRDVVALDELGLLVNGTRSERKHLGPCIDPELRDEGNCALYEEVLGAHRYRVAQLEVMAPSARMSSDRCPASTEPVEGGCRVLPGHLFVLGDNRDNSHDSRYRGAVPLANVKAVARFVFFAYAPDGELRPERIGTRLD